MTEDPEHNIKPTYVSATLLSGFGMDEGVANSVDLDILCIVHIHELFVDVRSVRPGQGEFRVIFAGFVGHLEMLKLNKGQANNR